MARVLYISYSGIMEPLGQSQVLQYLKVLAKQHTITLVSFERPNDWQDIPRRESLKTEVRQAGIKWVPLTYHKRPSALATVYDILSGLLVGAFLVIRHKINVVHARSYVPSVIALSLKKLFGLRYIFDMRGFWADERIDGGIWPRESKIYRVAKWFEKKFLLSADVVVSLTHAGIEEIQKFSYMQGRMPPFEVIPTCTNLELFYPRPANEAGSRPFTLGYVGSVGTWYLLDEMIEFFKVLRGYRPDARMIFVNRHDHDLIRQRLAALGVEADCIEITSANHAEVVTLMHRIDAGILFIKPVFSKKASAPTKLGEFLGCGIPCLGNAGVGDVDSILDGSVVGVVLRNFDAVEMEKAVVRLLEFSAQPNISERCRNTAEDVFSLSKGAMAYDRLYQALK